MSKSWCVGIEELASRGVVVVLTMRLRRSSFGENLRAGSMRQLSIWMASSKWSGHAFGKSAQFIVCHPSSPTSGAHRRASTYNKILLVPSTRPLTQGEYAATTWCRLPHFSQHCCTSLFLKCFPPSDMKTSAGAKLPYMSSSAFTVVFPVPAVLYLYPQTCCEKVSRYSPMV